MSKLLVLLLALTGLGVGAAWIADHPGQVTMYWFDYRIDTSLAVLLAAMLAAAAVLTFVYMLLRAIIQGPANMRRAREAKLYKSALRELTYSVAALASADSKGALAHTKKVERLLGRSPLTIMLNAQVARSQGDETATRTLLEQLLDHKETEYLAARSLSDVANQQQLFPTALGLAKRAYESGPKDTASITTLISLHLRLGQWQEALTVIRKAGHHAYPARGLRKRHMGLVHLHYATLLLDTGRYEAAVEQARNALALLPDFIPAALCAAQAYGRNDHLKRAVDTLMRAWKRSPHPQLLAVMRTVTANEPPEKQRKLLAPMLDTTATGVHWQCSACGHAQDTWTVHCASCGAFDTLIWR